MNWHEILKTETLRQHEGHGSEVVAEAQTSVTKAAQVHPTPLDRATTQRFHMCKHTCSACQREGELPA